MSSTRPEPLSWHQHDAQTAFCHAAMGHRVTAFFGGLQAGKSLAGADACRYVLYGSSHNDTGLPWMPAAVRLPEGISGQLYPEFWILSKSYVLADQAWSYFRWRGAEHVMTAREVKEQGLVRQDSRTYWLRPSVDGMPIRVRVRTAHDPELLRATGTLLLAWGDEIAHWPELAWLNLQGRGIVTPTRYLLTTTPKGKNWLYRDVYLPGVGGRDEGIAVVTCRSQDNPAADQEYLKRLRMKFGPEYAAQELDALFTANVGYVYDFDRGMHMEGPPSEDPDDYPVRVIGVDPGYGDTYAAGVWLRDEERRWWGVGELYRPGKAITADLEPWFTKQVKRWKVQKIYVDKRRPSDWQMLRRMGFPAVPNVDVFGEDGQRTVMPMIRIVQRVMREGRFKIASEMEWHAEEFENYAYPDRESKNQGENPQDFRNHAMDAMRYAIASVEALPEDLRPRYRRGRDQVPTAMARGRRGPVHVPTAGEWILAQDRRFDMAAKSKNGRDANRWRRGYTPRGGRKEGL